MNRYLLALSLLALSMLGGCVAAPYDPYHGAAYPALYPAQPVYYPYYSSPAPAYPYPSSSVYFGYSSGGHGRWHR